MNKEQIRAMLFQLLAQVELALGGEAELTEQSTNIGTRYTFTLDIIRGK